MTAAFAAAFLGGAVLVFAAASLIGSALRASVVSQGTRYGVAACLLLGLALVDVFAFRKATYCPLGRRRQTPRALMRRHRVVRVAATWGLDAGLAVTTFRVAALTWGALGVTALGFGAWWVGVGYGTGFLAPMLILLWAHPVGERSRARTPTDPGLEAMLRRRPQVQIASALVLTLAALAVLPGGRMPLG